MRGGRTVKIFSALLDLIYPPKCASCGEIIDANDNEALCERCRRVWEEEKHQKCRKCGQIMSQCWCGVPGDKDNYIFSERHLAQYNKKENSVVKNIVYACKNHNSKRTFDMIAAEMADEFLSDIQFNDVTVVPVPRSPKTKRKIGHDQSRCIASAFSAYTGIPVNDVIIHTGNKKQKTLTHAQRRENASKSYKIINGASSVIKGKTVILIDDIVTTGATVVRCAGLLKMRGAERVIVFSIAKTI